MHKFATKLWHPIRKHPVITVVLACVLLSFAIKPPHFSPGPTNLGPQLQYVGKDSYGCWWLICDSSPGNTYYFATNMTPEELRQYFKHADCSLPADIGQELDCKLLDGKRESFSATYIDKRSMGDRYLINEYSGFFNKSGKQLLLEIDKSDYAKAKAAL